MTQPLTIRPEQPADVACIRGITQRAFAGKPYADGDEQDLIESLRTENALVLSLVAQWEDTVVGQVTFSQAFAEDQSTGWYTLGPVAVEPSFQSRGIGAALINTGLTALVDMGARGCILTGNPLYYRRFGFELSPANVPEGESEEYFMLKLFAGDRPSGPMRFHPAFSHNH